MLKNKKREIVCQRTDCYFYSYEHAEVDGEWIPITFCSHPQNELILNGKSCNLYRMDWAKQMQKLKRTHPSDRVKLERQAMLKLLQSGIGNLSPDERDAALGLVEQLKQQEERLDTLSEVLKEIDETSAQDPFVIPDPEPPPVETPAPEPPPNNSFTSAFAISGRSYPRNDRAAIAEKEDKNVKITDFCFLVPGHAIRA